MTAAAILASLLLCLGGQKKTNMILASLLIFLGAGPAGAWIPPPPPLPVHGPAISATLRVLESTTASSCDVEVCDLAHVTRNSSLKTTTRQSARVVKIWMDMAKEWLRMDLVGSGPAGSSSPTTIFARAVDLPGGTGRGLNLTTMTRYGGSHPSYCTWGWRLSNQPFPRTAADLLWYGWSTIGGGVASYCGYGDTPAGAQPFPFEQYDVQGGEAPTNVTDPGAQTTTGVWLNDNDVGNFGLCVTEVHVAMDGPLAGLPTFTSVSDATSAPSGSGPTADVETNSTWSDFTVGAAPAPGIVFPPGGILPHC